MCLENSLPCFDSSWETLDIYLSATQPMAAEVVETGRPSQGSRVVQGIIVKCGHPNDHKLL